MDEVCSEALYLLTKISPVFSLFCLGVRVRHIYAALGPGSILLPSPACLICGASAWPSHRCSFACLFLSWCFHHSLADRGPGYSGPARPQSPCFHILSLLVQGRLSPGSRGHLPAQQSLRSPCLRGTSCFTMCSVRCPPPRQPL